MWNNMSQNRNAQLQVVLVIVWQKVLRYTNINSILYCDEIILKYEQYGIDEYEYGMHNETVIRNSGAYNRMEIFTDIYNNCCNWGVPQ